MNITKNAATKVAAVATGLTMAVSMLAAAPVAHAALSASQVAAIISLLQSFGADAATIANVQASLTGGTPSGGGGGGGSSSCSFTRDLTIGATGADVTCLQNALIASGYSIPAGATGYFGAQSQAAVSAWQKAMGITPTAGYFGAKSRAAFNLGGGGGGGGGGPVIPVTGNGLKVMLATDSPNGTALVQGQAAATLGKFTFQNPTGSPVTVTNLAFNRIGVSNDSTMTNVYLFNGAVRLTDSAGVSSSAFNFNNPTGLFVVPAGGWITVSVNADIAASTAGQQIGVRLVSVAASGALDTSVALPINGGLQAVSAATLATVDFNSSTLPSASTVDPQADYTVWQNTVTVGTRAVNMRAFGLRQIGSAQAGDLTNYRLYVDGVKIGPTVTAKDMNDMITFDLSGAPVRLETGGRVVKVVADVVGGASRTFQLSLRYPGDAIFVDTDLNQPVLATANGSTFSARTATSATINSVSTSAPSVSRSTDSPTSNVSAGATNVKWATFKIIAQGEAVKVENMNVSVNTSIRNGGLDNGKIFLNGVQVGSTKDLDEYGSATTNFTFGSSFIVPIGQTAVVDIYADAKTSTSTNLNNGETVLVYLQHGMSNAQGQVSLSQISVPSSEVQGNTITISSSSLTASKSSSWGNQTFIAGSTQAKIGAFQLSAGSTEGVNVNTIDIGFASAVSSTITNLTVKNKATGAQFGSTKGSVGTSNTFSGSVNIPASGGVEFEVFADVKSDAGAGPIPATTVTTSTTGTGATTGTSVSVGTAATLQTITVGSANLIVSQNTGSTPNNANVIAGSSSVKVGSFRFTTQYSPYTVQELKVKVPANVATSVGSVMIKYCALTSGSDCKDTTRTADSFTLSTGGQSHATATFTGLTFYVPADTNRDLEVYVSIPTVAAGATSGADIRVVLDANEGFKAVDSAGASDTSLNSSDIASNDTGGKGTMYVRRSAPTIGGSGITTSLAVGSDQAIGRFTISADAAGDIDWGQIAFNVTKTTSVNIGATSTLKVWDVTSTQTEVGGIFATTTGALLGGLDAIPAGSATNIYFRPTTVQTVAAGSTRTYELRGTVADGASSGTSNVTVTLNNIQTTATSTATFGAVSGTQALTSTPSFVWSDWSDPTDHATSATGANATDWIADFLVQTLPFTAGNRSLSH